MRKMWRLKSGKKTPSIFTNDIIFTVPQKYRLSACSQHALGALSEQEGSAHSVYLTGKTLGWNLESLSYKTLELAESNYYFYLSSLTGFDLRVLFLASHETIYFTTWSHRNFTDITIRMELTVAKAEETNATQITKLSIKASDKNAPMPELEPLIKKCCELCQPPKFFAHFEAYMKLYVARENFLRNQGLLNQINRKSGSFCITFDCLNNAPMARVTWSIRYDKLADSFVESYEVHFTEKGALCHR